MHLKASVSPRVVISIMELRGSKGSGADPLGGSQGRSHLIQVQDAKSCCPAQSRQRVADKKNKFAVGANELELIIKTPIGDFYAYAIIIEII